MPRARSEVVTVSMRSVSFTRNSRAPSTLLSPRAAAAASANKGSSSTIRGTSSARTLVATSGAEWTSRSPTRSPPLRRRWKTVIRAPIRSSTSSKPVRRAVVRGLDAGSHFSERHGNAVDRAPKQGSVAGQLESTGLAREKPGQEPHRRSGIRAVDRRARLAETAQADPFDSNRVDVVLVHGDPECPQCGHGRLGVARSPEVPDERLPLADPADHQRPVRDRLVAGDGDVANQCRGGLDLHRSESTGETTTP